MGSRALETLFPWLLVAAALAGCRTAAAPGSITSGSTSSGSITSGSIALGIGADDLGVLQNGNQPSAGALAEYRAPPVWKRLRPLAGLQYSSRRSLLGYAGAGYEVPLRRRLFLTPSFSLAAFERGTGKDVGSTLQFRSAVEFAHERANGHRVGLVFQHVSNGKVRLPNPGTESAYLTYAIPLGSRR